MAGLDKLLAEMIDTLQTLVLLCSRHNIRPPTIDEVGPYVDRAAAAARCVAEQLARMR